MPKRVLYLIRNGEYDRSAIDEEYNAPLTARGIDQAQRTANALKGLPIENIYTSPREQTGQTANILHESLPETGFYSHDDLKQHDNANVTQTFTREMMMRAMESNTDSQTEQAYNTFFQPPDEEDIHEVLVSHGDIILDLVCFATGVNPDSWSHMLINNCAINIITIESNGQTSLVAFNDVRHLPDKLRTE